jgi:hypothetical protein
VWPWRGKRVELSVYLRTHDIVQSTGLNMRIWSGSENRLSGSMGGGRLRIAGTRDWTRLATVLDVPADATRIEIGVGLWGTGRVWMDSFELRAVPPTVPTTSGSTWHLSTRYCLDYRLSSDLAELRHGHATARLESVKPPPASAPSSPSPSSSPSLRLVRADEKSATVVRTEHALDDLRGKRVRITAMIRSQDVATGAGVIAAAYYFDAQRSLRTQTALLPTRLTGTRPDLPVRGTTGWLKYSVLLDVPANSEMLEYGVRLQGAGTVWVDDVTVEVMP